MRIRVTSKVQTRGDLSARIAKIRKSAQGPKSVKVGLIAGLSSAKVIEYGVYVHEGTAGGASGGGWGGPVPPRPFLQVAMFKHRAQFKQMTRAAAKKVLSGDGDLRQQLNAIGLNGVNWVREQISSNMAPANSPTTIKIKGSGQTLIHSGAMLANITYKVE